MDRERERVRRYLTAIENFDAEAALACCTAEMTQTEYPNMLTPMVRRRDRAAMAEGIVAARGMLVKQSYEIVSTMGDGTELAVEMVWRAELRPGPLPEKMTAYFAAFFAFENGLISSQRNYDCFERPA